MSVPEGVVPETGGSSRNGLRGGPRIAFFSASWITGSRIALGGSDYWRLAIPASTLLEQGWDVMFARAVASDKEGRLHVQDPAGYWHGDRDVIVFQRWMGRDTAARMTAARAAGQVVVQDVDDHYWDIPRSHVARRYFGEDGHSEFNEKHYRETLGASSLVVVSTPYLADELADCGAPVRVIPNYIDIEAWPQIPPGEMIGWVGATPWRGNDLGLLRETVVPWLRERGLFFYHGGHLENVSGAADQLEYDRVSTRSVVGIENYPSLWKDVRVALIPVDPTPFGLAKSWIKPLEASARGVPFIASDHPEYRALGVGRIVKDPGDWVRHLEALEDPETYRADVERNRARAEELSIQRHWTEWAEMFDEVGRQARPVASEPKISEDQPRLPVPQYMTIGLKPEIEASLLEIPSAVTLDERRLALHVAATVWDGKSDVFENGPLLGGATRALALGMMMNPERSEETQLKTYDWFSFYETLDVSAKAFDELVDVDPALAPVISKGREEGSFLPVFEYLHAEKDYSHLVKPRVGYLPGHRDEEAPDGAPLFSVPEGDFYSLLFVDGCKSWHGTKFWITELCPALAPDAQFLFQDFGWHTCFWLPVLLGRLGEYFAATTYCLHTYGFRLIKPLTPEVIDAAFPDEPTDLSREEFDAVFDQLISHAEFRNDSFGKGALSAQRAAAYAYIGLVDEAKEILDSMLTKHEYVSMRNYLKSARRSPTYTPEHQILL